MSSYDRIQALLAHRRHSLVLSKVFSLALTVGLLTFINQAFAYHIKVAYAALSAGQIAVWIAKDGGYLASHGIDADVIYIPQVAATQALIAGEIQLAQVTGVSTAGAILGGADARIVASS